MEKESNKKGMRAVIALVVVILIGVIVLTVAITNMIKETGGGSLKEDTTEYTLAGVTNNNEEKSTLINWSETEGDAADNAGGATYGYISGNTGDNTAGNVGGNTDGNVGGNADGNNGGNVGNLIGGFIGNLIGGHNGVDADGNNNGDTDNTVNSKVPTSQNSNSNIEAGDVVTIPTTTKKPGKYDPVAEYEELTKNGDNILSDHHNNKYIKLVSEKFGVDKELLVAIYSAPDTGNNFVLEFDGKRDKDGNVIKSPDTLKKVYQIDKNKNIAVATGKTTGNIGVSYAEGTLCFNMIKTIVMPQYPEYFTGVED